MQLDLNRFEGLPGGARQRLTTSVLFGVALLLLFLAPCAYAQDPAAEQGGPPAIFSLQVENDGLTEDADGDYTNGFRLSYLESDAAPMWLRSAAGYLPFFSQQGTLRTRYALGQSIFTPDDIKTSQLIKDDRPYAGWLYFGIGLISDERKDGPGRFKNRRDSLELNVGMVGPASLAEEMQKLSHEVRDANKPKGWDHQLKNEPGIMLIYDRQWQGNYDLGLDGLSLDLIPHIGAALGNVMTYAATGATLRFGSNLAGDYGVPLVRPSAPGSTYFAYSPGLSWYLFAGTEGRVVLQNIFLDGNTFTDSHSVDKEYWVGDLQTGLVLTWKDYRISFTNVWRSKEFEERDSTSQYGSISFSMRL